MGFLKKIFKPVQKITDKIIPKELKPFLPYIAAAMGPAGLTASGILSNPAITKAIIAGATAAATDEDANILRTAVLAGAPDALSQGLGKFAGTAGAAGPGASAANVLEYGDPGFFQQKAILGAANASSAIEGAGALKTIGAQGAVDFGMKQAEIAKEELDAYNRMLEEQGIGDKDKRRSDIFNIYMGAGYDADYVNNVLDTYGYQAGGRVGLKYGGNDGLTDYMDEMYTAPPSAGITSIAVDAEVNGDDEEDSGKKKMSMKEIIEMIKGDKEDDKLVKNLNTMKQGLESFYGSPMTGTKPVPMMRFNTGGRVDAMNGGIMNTRRGFVQYPGGYAGDGEEIISRTDGESGVIYRDPDTGESITSEEFLKKADAEEFKNKNNKKKKKSKKKSVEEELREETPRAYPFMMGTSPLTHLRRYLKNNKANGGVINLMGGGSVLPPGKEMDYRKGGMIPMGTKERADDVPARLSKNEFVMTADAVRAAGGGSVNQGAKRMYELMNNLEAKV